MAPESISNHTAIGIMEIRWQDGTEQPLSHVFLRENCQCADCKAVRRSEDKALTVPCEIKVTGIVPVGAYAMQLIFSDGHTRGIFPWLYLKSLGDASPLGLTQNAS